MTLTDWIAIAGVLFTVVSGVWALLTWRHAKHAELKHAADLSEATAKAEGHALGAILGELRQWRQAMTKEVDYNELWRHNTMIPFIEHTGIALAKVSTEVSGLGGRIARIEGAMNGWLTGATKHETLSR